jgi:sodium/hydrogen exchanger-like protein 6/7
MLWFSGLRGAMAFALAVQNTVTPERRMFFTTTCLISIITVIVLGGLTVPMISFFKVREIISTFPRNVWNLFGFQIPIDGSAEEAEALLPGGGANCSLNEDENSLDSGGSSSQAKCVRMLKKMDKHFLKPLLTHGRPSLVETLPAFCLPLSRYVSIDQASMAFIRVPFIGFSRPTSSSTASSSTRSGVTTQRTWTKCFRVKRHLF